MSQQVTKEKYSIETLRERNVSYDHQHWLTQEDVDMANSYVELIERTCSKITPQIGDRLVYVTEHGDYYGNALIDSRNAKEGYLSVCEQPYVPCFRRVGRDNQPVVTTYKAYPRSLPPPQIQDTRHRYDHTQQHRRTVQPV